MIAYKRFTGNQVLIVKTRLIHILGIFGFILLSNIGMAQASKVVSAYNYYMSGELLKARDYIEDACENPKTSEWSKTWYYRGLIYSGIYYENDAKYSELKDIALNETYVSLKKARSLTEKRANEEDMNRRYRILADMMLNEGVSDYNDKKYLQAAKKFETCFDIKQEHDIVDSLAAYNVALANEQAGKIETAAKWYRDCIKINYNPEANYVNLVFLYQQNGMDSKALTTLQEGRTRFPSNMDLLISSINMNLRANRIDAALNDLNQAIEKDDKNPVLFFSRGTIFDNLKRPEEAEKDYLKAIELNENYFDPYYNLGALYFNQGVDVNNQIESSGANEKELMEKANKLFEKAVAPLEKAHQIKPQDVYTLESLKQIYARTNQTEKYNSVKEKIEKIRG